MQQFVESRNENVPLSLCDHRKRDKLQETLPIVIKQLFGIVRTFVATKLRDKLQEKLPSVTAPIIC